MNRYDPIRLCFHFIQSLFEFTIKQKYNFSSVKISHASRSKLPEPFLKPSNFPQQKTIKGLCLEKSNRD